jgi:hypothetical protein
MRLWEVWYLWDVWELWEVKVGTLLLNLSGVLAREKPKRMGLLGHSSSTAGSTRDI